MKKIILLPLLVFAVILTACDPMAKINKELDEKATPIAKKTEYTLTKADYNTLAALYVKQKMVGFTGDDDARKKAEAQLKKEASSLSSKQAFNDKATANELVPQLLQQMFREWGKGSTVAVHYNQMVNRSKTQEAIWNAAYAELNDEQLKSKGIEKLSPLSEKNIAALTELVAASGEKNNKVFLAKLTLQKKSRFVLVISGKEAGKEYYALQPDDFTAMGLRFPNFSSSAQPDSYLTVFMNSKFAYAKEGDRKVVVYPWFSGKDKPTTTRSSEYVFSSGRWSLAETVTSKVDQFLHNGERWLFDPTIVYALTKDDFVVLFNYVKANHPNYVSKKYPTNEEFWFCGSSYYGNFNIDGGETVGPRDEEKDLKGDALIKAREARVIEGVQLILSERFPNYPAVNNGVDQYYEVHAVVRVNFNNETRVYRFKGLGDNKYEQIVGDK